MISSYICSFWKVAFFDAAKRGDVDEVDRLIKEGANVNQKDDTANQLIYAIFISSMHAVHTYLQIEDCPNIITIWYHTIMLMNLYYVRMA